MQIACLLSHTINISLSWSFVLCLWRIISVTQMFTRWSGFVILSNPFLLRIFDTNDNHILSVLSWTWPSCKTITTFRNFNLLLYSVTRLLLYLQISSQIAVLYKKKIRNSYSRLIIMELSVLYWIMHNSHYIRL